MHGCLWMMKYGSPGISCFLFSCAGIFIVQFSVVAVLIEFWKQLTFNRIRNSHCFYLVFSTKCCETLSVQVRMARQDLQDHETTCWAFQPSTLPSSESANVANVANVAPPLPSPESASLHKILPDLPLEDVVKIVWSTQRKIISQDSQQFVQNICRGNTLWEIAFAIICNCTSSCYCNCICIHAFVNIKIPILQPSQNCGAMCTNYQEKPRS